MINIAGGKVNVTRHEHRIGMSVANGSHAVGVKLDADEARVLGESLLALAGAADAIDVEQEAALPMAA